MLDFNMWIVPPLVFLAGFIDSIAGGGGLISLPAYFAAGLPPHIALGSNKFSSCFGTMVSTARFMKSKKIHYKTAFFSMAFAFVGSAIGAQLAMMIDEKYIRYILIILVPIIAVFTLMNKNMDNPKQRDYSDKKMCVIASIIGLVLGAYDGFFGPGMGMFLILVYVNVLGFDVITAGGNAKMVNLASNLAAAATFIISGNVMYQIAIPSAICGILGNYLGSGLAIKNGSKVIKPVMIVVMVLLLLKVGSEFI